MNKKVYEVTVYNHFTQWKLNNKLHCEHGPAVIHANGYVAYWQNGKLHNEHGPAVILADGTVQYWLNNKQVTEVQVMKPHDGTIIEKDGVQYRLTAV